MKDQLSEQQAEAILQALDDAIEKGPWEESAFLKVIGKNLREIRDKFAMQLNLPAQQEVETATHLANQAALRSDQQEIFIALYSTNGGNMLTWERIIANLPKQMISRPIYANEKDVKDIIKTKVNKTNEAYVSMYVNQTDILFTEAEKTPKDKLGKALLSLKNKSLILDNVNRFVHESGVYKLTHARLVKNVVQEDD